MFRLSSCLFVLLLAAACARPLPPTAEIPAGPPRSERPSSVVPRAAPPLVVASPALPVVQVDLERARGSRSAPLALVEFADYQCPYCRAFHVRTLPRLQAEFIQTGKLRYFYKDFPLPNHAHAFDASVAAYCAGAQGRYWQMQEFLYADQARLGEALYAELAAELGLDKARFETCRRSPQARAAVNRDLNEGRRLGVRATPTFMLGRLEGDRVVIQRTAAGVPAFEVFVQELEALAR